MKKNIITLAICLCSIVAAFGQKSDSLTLKDLEIPNSPGFILLDKTPTTIERPNSTKAFMLSALNSFTDNNGIPKNYAVDFTPFWFFKHPKMTSYKYMGYNKVKDRQNIFKDFKKVSISFAFLTTTDSATKNQINNLSLGLRTNLLSVRSKKDIEDYKEANTKLIGELKKIDSVIKLIPFPNPSDPINKYLEEKKAYDEKLTNYLTQKELEEKDINNDLSDILKRRAVFAIDGAIGYNNFFLDNNYSSSHFGRFGAWLTVNYSQILETNGNDKNYLNIYALGRYLSDGTKMENNKYVLQNFYDFGGKLELEFKNISIAYEYIYRINDKKSTFRSNGILKYKISDQVFLNGAFGKNFGYNNNLISLLGLNWGISSGTEQSKIVKD